MTATKRGAPGGSATGVRSTAAPGHRHEHADSASAEALTVLSSTCVVRDEASPAGPALAALTCVASWLPPAAGGPEGGPELAEGIVTSVLHDGFAPCAGYGLAELSALPVLRSWAATVDDTGSRLRIVTPEGPFYDGHLGPGVGADWYPALSGRGVLAVLLAAVALPAPDRRAEAPARVVGAQVPVRLVAQGPGAERK